MSDLAEMLSSAKSQGYKEGLADGRTNVIKMALFECNSFINHYDCLECPFVKYEEDEWAGCYLEQLKEQKDEIRTS